MAIFREKDYVPLNKDDLRETLGLARRDRRKLDYELRLLLKNGKIVRIKQDRYCIPQDADLVTGKIHFRQTGSAIVIPDATDGANNAQPIQIEAQDTSVAMHGDQVVIRLREFFDRPRPRRRRGRPDQSKDQPYGRVIRIKERARSTIVGNLQKTRLFYYVVPDDPRLINDIYVQDPKKCSIRPRPKIGSKVVVKLHPWKQRHVNPEGEIIKNLGETHEPQAELQAILHKYNLDPDFPEAALKDAKAIPSTVSNDQLKGRRDMRDAFTFTIDPDDAKDFDDALSIEKLEGENLRIGIHIADVAAYVQPGQPLDKEASSRGNSTYLVGVVIPMLPRELSNGICSLVEGEDRLTKSVFIDFSSSGKAKGVDFANTVIRSNKRLTYKQAYTLLIQDDIQAAKDLPLPPAHQTGSTGRKLSDLRDSELAKLQKGIRQLWNIASKLRASRMRKGALNLDIPETKIFVDKEGYADRLEKIENDESHQLIEEFMLAANQAVAKEMRNAGLPCVYRTHEQPDEEKLLELREYLATFGIETGDLFVREEMNSAIQKIESHAQGHLLKTQLLRSMKKAKYTASPDGHYGLNMQNYCHFTSPIRRYSDLVVHRVFEFFLVKHKGQAAMSTTRFRYNAGRVAGISESLSLTEVNSVEAERESVKVKLLEFFERELGKPKKTQFTAVITEARNHGLFIELVESGAYGLVHVSTLRDLYRLNAAGNALVGRRNRKSYRVGQKVNVFVERVDRFKRQVDFRISG